MLLLQSSLAIVSAIEGVRKIAAVIYVSECCPARDYENAKGVLPPPYVVVTSPSRTQSAFSLGNPT